MQQFFALQGFANGSSYKYNTGITTFATEPPMLRLLLILSLFSFTAAHADSAPRIDSLAWMTGTWAGPLGESVIEEVWTAPQAGSISAAVRFLRDKKTTMFEYITIAEEGQTLVLRLMQWGPGMQPLKELHLVSQGKGEATFASPGSDGGLSRLIYRRESEDTFSVEVTTTEGNNFKIAMRRPG